MSLALKAILIIMAVSVSVPVGYVFYELAMSPNDWVYEGGSPSNWRDGGIHGAPGPIAGAGLPIIAIGGAFWLYRRYRRKPRPTDRITHDAKLKFSSKDRSAKAKAGPTLN